MTIKNLRELKKSDQRNLKKRYFKWIVVGNGLSMVLTAEKIKNHNPADSILFLRDQEIFDFQQFQKGPTSFRGEDNLNCIKELYPQIEFKLGNQGALFYKDQKFNAFNGRVKPFMMVSGEEFFLLPKIDFDQNLLFNNDLVLELENKSEYHPIRRIKKIEPQDLIEPGHWEIETNDDQLLVCENLVVGLAPLTFLNLLSEKEKLSEGAIDFLEQASPKKILVVDFELSGPFFEEANTYFLPISQTHEMGHFIGEQIVRNEKFIFSFFCFLQEDPISQDEVTNKVRLLKKSIEKIWPKLKKNIVEEKFYISEGWPPSEIEDQLFENVVQEFSNIIFVGPFAPISPSLISKDNFVYSKNAVSFSSREVITSQIFY